ncbi:CBS domain-containing protein, partial [bacterium]
LYFPENITVDKIFAAMRKNHTQMIIVSDEYGGTEGLITIDDIFEQVIGSAA